MKVYTPRQSLGARQIGAREIAPFSELGPRNKINPQFKNASGSPPGGPDLKIWTNRI